MPSTVECPGCRRSYEVPEAHRGRAVRCKQCGTAFTLSATDTVEAPSLPALATLVAQAVAEEAAPPGAAEPPVPSAKSAASARSPVAASGTKSDPAGGRTIGRFRLGVRLGQGAFGAVYRAFDTILQREVALKLPLARALESPEARARLEREPKAAAQLHHPHIVPVYDAGFAGDQFFIASAFIEGRTLDAALGGSAMNPVRAATIVEKLAEALDYAHRLGIVHRDVKPSNVMLDPQDEPHLFDFGLAHWHTPDDENLTTDGSLLGTPAYMSPEQAGAPVGDVGPASDQYALGVILYELLSGKRPFDGPPLTVMYQIREQEPERLGRRAPHVPRDLEAVCHKALEKRPQARYALCGELAADLRRWRRGETVRARRPGPIERARRWAGRNRALAASFAVAVVLAAISSISAVGFRTFYTRAADHAHRAETALTDLQRETAARRTTESLLQDRETKVAEQEKLLTTRAAELKQRDSELATRTAEIRALSADLLKGEADRNEAIKKITVLEQQISGSVTLGATTQSIPQVSDSLPDAAMAKPDENSQASPFPDSKRFADAQTHLIAGRKQEALKELDACSPSSHTEAWRFLKALASGTYQEIVYEAASGEAFRQTKLDPRGETVLNLWLGFRRNDAGVNVLFSHVRICSATHNSIFLDEQFEGGVRSLHRSGECFSSDGKRLVLIMDGDVHVFIAGEPTWSHFVVDAKSVEPTLNNGFEQAAWSPSGRTLYLLSRSLNSRKLYHYDVDSRSVRGQPLPAPQQSPKARYLMGKGAFMVWGATIYRVHGDDTLGKVSDKAPPLDDRRVAIHPFKPVVFSDGRSVDYSNIEVPVLTRWNTENWDIVVACNSTGTRFFVQSSSSGMYVLFADPILFDDSRHRIHDIENAVFPGEFRDAANDLQVWAFQRDRSLVIWRVR